MLFQVPSRRHAVSAVCVSKVLDDQKRRRRGTHTCRHRSVSCYTYLFTYPRNIYGPHRPITIINVSCV